MEIKVKRFNSMAKCNDGFSLSHSVQINDLRPDTTYIFVVRAENSHGMSVPSGASNIVRTLGTYSTTPQHLLDNARSKLSNKVLVLRDLFPLSSTSVRIVWDVSSNNCNRIN